MKIRLMTAALAALMVGSLFGATRTEAIREKLASGDRDYVFVIMHRGDWRNFPENSKGAILSSVRLGADIVELDVHMTKDGRFILNHDRTLDRTTTGKGKVCDLTLAEIKQFKMRDKDGKPTDYDVLTLEEALELTRGKTLINIDKFTLHPKEILDAVAAVGALKEVLVKSTLPIEKAKELFGPYWSKVESGELLYMPVAHISTKGYKTFGAGVVPGYLAAEPRRDQGRAGPSAHRGEYALGQHFGKAQRQGRAPGSRRELGLVVRAGRDDAPDRLRGGDDCLSHAEGAAELLT